MYTAINKYKDYIDLIRPYNATTIVLAFCIGYFFKNNSIDTATLILGIAVIILTHSIATIQNDINDIEIDKVNSPEKALASGKISINKAKKFSNILLLFVLAISFWGNIIHIIFISIILLISWLYNSSPFFISRKTYSPLIILALMYSVIPMLYGYILKNGMINSNIIYITIAWFFLRISISILKDFKDEKGDSMFNKNTFYLTHGKKITIFVSLFFSIISYLYIFYLLRFIKPIWVILIMIILFVRGIYLKYKLFKLNDIKLINAFHQIFFGQNQFDLILLIWLLIH